MTPELLEKSRLWGPGTLNCRELNIRKSKVKRQGKRIQVAKDRAS